ncbi:hypothetical protein DSO57_1029837 [Entomophthora muscae]|uniref:Uncharacterized protein n=1 Tax=Entomophthora muscae TaxID=34485 RepID=A0ACC2ULX5_9FUNG|nr:hypothetical protein DSO57_1029837 [Entomophthora muscae]
MKEGLACLECYLSATSDSISTLSDIDLPFPPAATQVPQRESASTYISPTESSGPIPGLSTELSSKAMEEGLARLEHYLSATSDSIGTLSDIDLPFPPAAN